MTLSDRGLKSVEVASTYVQVLIGLGSGIITAVLAVSPDLELVGFSSMLLKVSLGFLGTSIIAGLFGLGGLVGSISDENNAKPLESKTVTIPTTAQLVLFGIGIGMMVFVIPTS